MRLTIKLFVTVTMLFLLNRAKADSDGMVVDSLKYLLKTAKAEVKVDLYNQLSYEFRNINLERALNYADSAIWLAQKINYVVGSGNGYMNRGNYFKMTGNTNEAHGCYIWGYIQHKKVNNLKGISSAYNSLGGLNYMMGNFSRALGFFIRSLALSEQINDKQGVARTLNNIGVINLELKNYSRALEYYERAYHALKAINDENNMADALSNIGNVYHLQGLADEALRFYEQAYEANLKLGDLRDQSSAITNIGLVYFEKKEYKKALSYYIKSLRIDEQIGDQQAITTSCNNIANTYFHMGMFYAARQYALRSVAMAKARNFYIEIPISFDLLYKIEDKLGNYKEALEYYKLYAAYNDSLYNQEIQQKLETIEQQYEAEKTENERLINNIGKENKEAKKTTLQTRYLQTVTLVLLSFIGVVYLVFFVVKRNK